MNNFMARKKSKFKIEGMHCGSCCLMIDGDLEDAEGIISASTNYAQQKLHIEYDSSKINEKEIIEIIKKTGYDAYVYLE